MIMWWRGPFSVVPVECYFARQVSDCGHPAFVQLSPIRYTRKGMSVIKNIGAIAQGMGITLREMFQPTIVENYPDGPGPLRGAKFQERFRGMHVLQRDENGLEKCVACFLC